MKYKTARKIKLTGTQGFTPYFLQGRKRETYFLSRKRGAGFTLIELLVVISIIGILSSFAVVSLNNARVKARDAKRKAEMAQTRVALALYYDDYEQYPTCDDATWDEGEVDFGATPEDGSTCYNGVLNSALTSGSKPYMSELPKDLKNPNNDHNINSTYLYRYVATDSGDQFALVYETEDPTDNSPQIIRGW